MMEAPRTTGTRGSDNLAGVAATSSTKAAELHQLALAGQRTFSHVRVVAELAGSALNDLFVSLPPSADQRHYGYLADALDLIAALADIGGEALEKCESLAGPLSMEGRHA